jgi:hypothetical protein
MAFESESGMTVIELNEPLAQRWTLLNASMRRDGYPLAYLSFFQEGTGREASARLDVGKRAVIDRLPETLSVPEEYLKAISERLASDLGLRAQPQAMGSEPPRQSLIAPKRERQQVRGTMLFQDFAFANTPGGSYLRFPSDSSKSSKGRQEAGGIRAVLIEVADRESGSSVSAFASAATLHVQLEESLFEALRRQLQGRELHQAPIVFEYVVDGEEVRELSVDGEPYVSRVARGSEIRGLAVGDGQTSTRAAKE